MNETTGQTAKPWVARLICCGRDDGSVWFATRGEAEVFRSGYTAAEGHDRAAIISGHLSGQPQDDGAILAEYLEAMRADGLLRGAVEDAIVLAGRVRAEAGAARRERDDLRSRIADARAEIREQSTAHHVAQCGSPVGSVVDRVLAEVETHLVDPQYRPGGDVRPARAADVGVFEQLTGDPQPAHGDPQRNAGGPGPAEPGNETAQGYEAPQGAADGGVTLCGKRSSWQRFGGISGPCVKRPGHEADEWHLAADGAAWNPAIDERTMRARPPFAPEDEGIATADVLAQIAADEATARVPAYHAMRREQHPKGVE